MKQPNYYACCGRRYRNDEYNPGGDWRMCVWCKLRKAYAGHGLIPRWEHRNLAPRAVQRERQVL